MRLFSPLRACLALLCALLLTAPTAFADSGGAQAPSSDGGTSPDASVPAQRKPHRPIAHTFRVTPRRLKAGSLPRVAVRIDERGVKRVTLRIALVRVGHRHATATILIKKARTGRLLHPRWPAATRLHQGRYVIRVHAKGPHGATLRRTHRASGKVTISVVARPKPKPKPRPAPQPEPFPLPSSGAGVFPVAGPHSFGGDDARFGAKRKGHTHEGQDVIADRGTPVVAPLGGTINTADYEKGGAGYYIVLDASDSRSFFFAHCRKNTVVVTAGQAVSPGQRLCDVGRTGDATGPHLHFEIWVGGWRRDRHSRPVDPLDQLRAWDR